MKPALLLLLCFLYVSAGAQQTKPAFDGHTWEAPYYLPVPKDWTIERFQVPVSFAPQIHYKGVEDIRFAPGWAKQESDEYWTYAFLWYLDDKPETNAVIIADNLKHYYSGLLLVNTDSTKTQGETPVPVITSFKKMKRAKGDAATYAGTIDMRNYLNRKPIRLNCRVHLKYCAEEKKTIMFYELSPKPFTHSNWKSLNELWLGFSCKKTSTSH